MPDGPPQRADAERLVREAMELARQEAAGNALRRMAEDDLLDSSGDQSGSNLSSGSSQTGSSAGGRQSDGSVLSSLGESGDQPSAGTVAEQAPPTDTTVEVPEDQISEEVKRRQGSGEGAPSDDRAGVSLSGVARPPHGGSSQRSTLISTPRYRPTKRKPAAVLRVYDDDQRGFEEVRVRQTPFVIGRQDGDLVIGHDGQISRRHARIDRFEDHGSRRWRITDLKSLNGTFLRVADHWLEDGDQLQLGAELVRFLCPARGGPATLVYSRPEADEERCRLAPGERFIGSDPSCLPFIRSSPYLDPCSFRLEHTDGRWRVTDLESTNHLWVRREREELVDGAMFQLGEQRFTFLLP